MGKSSGDWRVLPHGPIERLEENLWKVEGTLPNMALRRVMTLIRLPDGKMMIHNAIAVNDETLLEIENWGTPGLLVVPSAYHRLDAPAFKERFPELKVYCPRGALRRVRDVVSVDGTYEEVPRMEGISFETLEGTEDAEGVLVVRCGDGITLIMNDILFNMPHLSGFQGFVFRHVTASSGGPRISRTARFFLLKNKVALRDHLLRLAALPNLCRVIVAHHEVLSVAPGEALRRVALSL